LSLKDVGFKHGRKNAANPLRARNMNSRRVFSKFWAEDSRRLCHPKVVERWLIVANSCLILTSEKWF